MKTVLIVFILENSREEPIVLVNCLKTIRWIAPDFSTSSLTSACL